MRASLHSRGPWECNYRADFRALPVGARTSSLKNRGMCGRAPAVGSALYQLRHVDVLIRKRGAAWSLRAARAWAGGRQLRQAVVKIKSKKTSMGARESLATVSATTANPDRGRRPARCRASPRRLSAREELRSPRRLAAPRRGSRRRRAHAARARAQCDDHDTSASSTAHRRRTKASFVCAGASVR